jgi:RNA polymerase sigma-70 factor (ECF subfamily)
MTERAARLLARLGERGTTLAADPQLGPLLDGLFDRAEGRLPHRPIRRDALVDRLADALLSNDEPPDREALMRLNAPDLYLALALAEKDIRALEIAESELMPAVHQAIGRIDASESFVDEVSQRVRERLFVGDGATPPAILQYRGTGPLARWVRVIASRVALDLKRSDGRFAGESEDALVRMPSPDDPDLEEMLSAYAGEYRAALAEAFTSLSRRERNLLRKRYLDELNLDRLGRIYRVNPTTTSRWLKQIEERLAAATRIALMAKLSISESQIRGMDRYVASQLQLSLPRMLRGDHGEGSGSSGSPQGGGPQGG